MSEDGTDSPIILLLECQYYTIISVHLHYSDPGSCLSDFDFLNQLIIYMILKVFIFSFLF